MWEPLAATQQCSAYLSHHSDAPGEAMSATHLQEPAWYHLAPNLVLLAEAYTRTQLAELGWRTFLSASAVAAENGPILLAIWWPQLLHWHLPPYILKSGCGILGAALKMHVT